ncbi:MAG: undecaprenyl-diphosphate phosphatase [Phycisphaerales bacterium]|nr:undecaprenyl-diphosphate phosphatase [Phycisphaerales bacterium]
MTYLLSVLLGIIQGLTEFLPISSTAHLRIAQGFLPGIDLEDGYWKMYSVVIQLGSILAVPILFKNRIIELIRTFPRGSQGDKNIFTHPLSLVMLAFCVTAPPCYFADKLIGDNLESVKVIASALIIGGIVMWLVDKLCKRPSITHMDKMSPLAAVWIGAVQILSAIFPGTSRSMSTIIAGQTFGLSRSTALEFSFFLALPTMIAATSFKLLQTLLKPAAREAVMSNAPQQPWLVLAVGFIVSFIVAYLTCKWFVGFVRTRGFTPFAVYRLVLGSALLIWLYVKS